MEIDWREAPAEANWAAMDENGDWFWFENEPSIMWVEEERVWDSSTGSLWFYKEDNDSSSWKASLQVRPVILGPDTSMTVSNPTPDHYNHTLNGVKVDPYKIADIYNITSHPQFHALKKILRAHQPNHKSLEQNIDEAISALQRWKEIINE